MLSVCACVCVLVCLCVCAAYVSVIVCESERTCASVRVCVCMCVHAVCNMYPQQACICCLFPCFPFTKTTTMCAKPEMIKPYYNDRDDILSELRL